MKQVLYFSAEWCGPCKMIKPMMQQLQSQMSITFIDADASTETCAKWGVRSIPTVIVVKGGMEAGRIVGTNITKDAVLNMYNK
jgi:thioredoxin 1